MNDMSGFWSWWVMALVVFNLSVTFALFIWAPRAKIPTLPDGTTGHVWAHGAIREGMHRLPMWWIVISLSMFIAAFIYLWLYPGFGANKGRLGWTSHGQLARETTVNQQRLDTFLQRGEGKSVELLAGYPEIVAMGQVLFRDNCAACHGRNGQGIQVLGAPNLADQDWLYGSGDAILTTILDGRNGAMPAWGAQFGDAGVDNLANYVLSLSGASHDAAKAEAGKAMFSVCAACHGASGKGNKGIGAPNLTDNIWLYGGDIDSIRTSIRDGRGGIMPAWRDRLSEDEARMIAAYVFSLSKDGSTRAQ